MSQPVPRKPLRSPDVNKATAYAVVVNGIQIAAILLFVFYALLNHGEGNGRLLLIVVVGGVLAVWGAVIDIADALHTRRRERTIGELQQTNDQMDALNRRLREQRHDFLNHIQVVYSLMEMEEYTDATAYLERVYNELRSVSKVLRTKMTAFNALLQVKNAACEERGIALDMDIRSTLEGIAAPPWEMCCIIGNLMDNAMDAAAAAPKPRVRLMVNEEVQGFRFTIANNGDTVPPALRERIFEPGVSTRGEGRGMGLSIVKKTLEAFGGSIALEAGEGETHFTVTVPRA